LFSVAALASFTFAADWNLSGTVTDASGGAGLAGVQVKLVVAGGTTTTGANGAWSITSAAVAPRWYSSSRVPNSLWLNDGRLRLTLDGADLLGRKIPAGWDLPPSATSAAGRLQAAVVDTLVYTKTGYVSKRVALTNSTAQGLSVQLASIASTGASNYSDTVNGVAIDMVYIPGDTFTLGCVKDTCPADTKPVPGVRVSNYHIAKAEVKTAQWNAVMGTNVASYGGASTSYTNLDWYDGQAFACKLSQLTGRNYRMVTEAEWEFAAKNHLSSLSDVGTGEEWAYNSWNSTHMGGTDPVGPNSGAYTQKTRRDAQGTVDNITGRLIRSIDGIGPALRLAVSDAMDFPPGMVAPCDIHAPTLGGEPENSYRDPRWITGGDHHWKTGSIAIGSFDLRVWDDGTAKLGSTNGQWFTSNNISLVFVPTTGALTKFAYIFLDDTEGSLITDKSFMSGGYIGRIVKDTGTNVAKPTITGLKSGADLAAAAGPDYKMIDMQNIPASAKVQDPRLLDGGTDRCWFQNNINAGGTHNYRKDIDADEFRFAVIDKGQVTMLANGAWFTVNHTLLRVTHPTGYVADYLYAIDSSSGTFYHNSFQGYERADFRMFKIYMNNSTDFPSTCIGTSCITELPKGADAPVYATISTLIDKGKSTFTPAPCPAAGCQ
jgi:hypothetical protein